MSKGWDNAMIKRLKALTGKGLSTAEIGKKLGLSKNAVVGKLNRLGWNSKASGTTTTTPKEKKTVAAKKKTTTTTPKKATPTVTARTTKKTPVTTKKTTTSKATPKATSTKKSTTTATKKTATSPAPKATPKAPATKAKAPKAQPQPKESKKNINKSLAMHQRIIQHSLEMANLKANQCRWPIGDPDSENFHFCGETVFVGKPYCYEHCKQAYQFTPPKKK